MSLQVFVGNGTTKTTTGTQAYSGVGFTPALIIFFNAGETVADGNIANGASIVGATDGTRNIAMGWSGETRAATSEGSGILSNTNCLYLGNENRASAAWQTRVAAAISSMNVDGFTLNFGTANGTAYQFGFIAIGGAGISCYVGDSTEGGTTGNFSITAPNFQPSFLMMLYGKNTIGNSTTLLGGTGYAVSSTMRAMTFHVVAQTQASPNSRNRLRTTKLWEVTTSGNDTIVSDGDFVSFDATGFTLNRLTDDATDRAFCYIAISGVSANITQISAPAATGSDPHTGVGFAPQLLILASHGETSASVGGTLKEAEFSFGAGTDSTHRAVACHCAQNEGASNQDSAATFETDEIISVMDPTTPTIQAQADLTSLDSDGYTLNYGVANGSAYLALAIALRDNTGGGATTYASAMPLLGVG